MSGELARREAANIGAQWIASAHPTPEQVWEDWDRHSVAIVPTGTAWDAVTMPYDRWLAVSADMGPLAWAHTPVLADMSTGRVYVVVPTGTAQTWSEPGTTALGEGSWLVMSKPGGPQDRAGQWITPPGLLTRLATPADLSAALRRTVTDNSRQEEGF
ncbi:hypothetical protein ACFXKW_20970 [Streptomyces sp. NPDC059193]|uniref:hypothetical protein n=1 Tax=Streptomyces sp. NPDC059193 TaxID=3346763 RepID=UPI0036B7446E